MKLLGLPGKNPRTERWIRDLLETLDLEDASIVVQRYRCWQDGGELDLETELSRAQRESPEVLVGKSMGAIVALFGQKRGLFPTARAYVLIGTPVATFPKEISPGHVPGLLPKTHPEQIQALLTRVSGAVPMLLNQQRHDPAGSSSAVRELIGGTSRATLVKLEGQDHAYLDIDELKGIIEPWLTSIGS